MFKKIVVVLAAVLLMSGMVFAQSKTSKKTTKPAAKTAAKTVKASSGDYKDLLGVSIDVMNREAGVRLWPVDTMGLDFNAGIGHNGVLESTGFNIGAGMVFPMAEADNLALNITPGMKIDYTSMKIAGTDMGEFLFSVGVGVELEIFVLKNFSISSSAGINFGVYSVSVGSSSETKMLFDLGRGTAVWPLVIRYYL
ncbi:MAG TPA: hypothetical protein ENN43_06955 [bacterium]|nr:hypothetical protein [bacterium]